MSLTRNYKGLENCRKSSYLYNIYILVWSKHFQPGICSDLFPSGPDHFTLSRHRNSRWSFPRCHAKSSIIQSSQCTRPDLPKWLSNDQLHLLLRFRQFSPLSPKMPFAVPQAEMIGYFKAIRAFFVFPEWPNPHGDYSSDLLRHHGSHAKGKDRAALPRHSNYYYY